MSMETALVSVLKAICPRVSPDVAPIGTASPYMVYQGIGGVSLRYIDNVAASKRNTLVQVSAWAASRADALSLIRQAEDAVCALPALQASPQGEPLSMHDEESNLYGSVQRFSIWADR